MNIRNTCKLLINNRFHALTHKNYRYFWFGSCVSTTGTWIQNIGLSWLVLTMTGSPFLLGLVGTVQFLPVTFFSLFAGTVIDRFPKKQILLVTATISMTLAFILSVLVFTNTLQYSHVIVFALLMGLNNTFDMPTRQTFNIEIVGKEDLANAIALNSIIFNLARIVGPAIGAFMMAYLGAGWCFLLNGLSFLAVIYGMLHIQAVPYVRQKIEGVGIFREIKDGIVYMAKDRFLAQTILLLLVVGTLSFNWQILIPVFTKNVLLLDEKAYGFLMSCLGVGSIFGAITMSLRSKKGANLSLSILSCIIISVFLMLNGLSGSLIQSGLLLAVSGFFNIIFVTNCNASMQLHSKDEYRTRVMSVYSLVFAGSTPIGNLFSGYVADRYGADDAFTWNGLLILIPCLIIIFVYRKKKSGIGEQLAS